MKSIEENLKEYILSKYKSIRAFTKEIDVPYSTIDNMLKRGIGGTGMNVIFSVCKALNIDTDELANGKIAPKIEKTTVELSKHENLHIKKYRELDTHGKKMVDFTLDEEYERCISIEEEEPEELPTIEIKSSVYNKVSAGTGYMLDTEEWETIEIPDTYESRQADFALTISGDSMEPIYYDGDMVLVKAQPQIEIGEIGIFIINGEGFIKKYGGDRLISLNDKYHDIIFSEYDYIICCGKVIGRV